MILLSVVPSKHIQLLVVESRRVILDLRRRRVIAGLLLLITSIMIFVVLRLSSKYPLELGRLFSGRSLQAQVVRR